MVGLLILLFLVTPVVEIFVIIQVGQRIGALATVALLVAESALGAWLVRKEGRRAWEALRSALGTGRLPGGELADAALVLVGGTLLLTPGFVTDIVGFFLILPLTRPLARRALGAIIARRAGSLVVGRPGSTPWAATSRAGTSRANMSWGRRGAGRRGTGETPRPGEGPHGGEVIEGEVVDDPEGGRG